MQSLQYSSGFAHDSLGPATVGAGPQSPTALLDLDDPSAALVRQYLLRKCDARALVVFAAELATILNDPTGVDASKAVAEAESIAGPAPASSWSNFKTTAGDRGVQRAQGNAKVMPRHQQQSLALDALQVYAPVVEALGVHGPARVLEAAAYRSIFPESWLSVEAWYLQTTLQAHQLLDGELLVGTHAPHCSALLRA